MDDASFLQRKFDQGGKPALPRRTNDQRAGFKSRHLVAVSSDFPLISTMCVELRGMMQAMVRKRIRDEKSPRRNFVPSNRISGI
jgi:hypothetical protein